MIHVCLVVVIGKKGLAGVGEEVSEKGSESMIRIVYYWAFQEINGTPKEAMGFLKLLTFTHHLLWEFTPPPKKKKRVLHPPSLSLSLARSL